MNKTNYFILSIARIYWKFLDLFIGGFSVYRSEGTNFKRSAAAKYYLAKISEHCIKMRKIAPKR